MYEEFKAKAEAVSAEVHRFESKTGALDFIISFLEAEGVTDAPGNYALWAESPLLDAVDRRQLEKNSGLSFQITQELAAMAKIGISQADFAMADTGTLVQDSTAIEQRLVSTLPEIHLALLSTGAILPDMPALLCRVHPASSGYIAMITGPSRTADIERVLTIGVHGPSRLVIVCVDEPGGATDGN